LYGQGPLTCRCASSPATKSGKRWRRWLRVQQSCPPPKAGSSGLARGTVGRHKEPCHPRVGGHPRLQGPGQAVMHQPGRRIRILSQQFC
jgi:hypothetical protein